MDTQTVLDIIKMIENKAISSTNEWRAERIENIVQGKDPDTELHTKYLLGVADGILLVSLHLQNYIESQLNAAENQTVE